MILSKVTFTHIPVLRVNTQRRHTQRGKEENKTAIIYNDDVTVWNIPLEAYEYVVNGKSAIEWSMERHAVTTHKKRLPRPACVGPPAFNFPLPVPMKFAL